MSENAPIQTLSFEQYQAAPGVSNSMLSIIRERTPLHLWQYLNGPKPESTPAQRFGSLLHSFLLQPDTMKDAYYIKPDGHDGRTAKGKAWTEEHQGKPILTADEHNAIEAMVKSVHHHPSAKRLLANATYEQSIFVDDDKGTRRKLRPDVLPNAGDYLPDIKTCESAHPDDFAKAIANYGWYRQAAYYLDGCALAGREYRAFVFIAVEKTPPYAVACHVLDPIAVDLGRLHYSKDLETYRECVASNRWPGYPDTPRGIELPHWMSKELESAA